MKFKGLDVSYDIDKDSFITITPELNTIAYVDGGSSLILDNGSSVKALIYGGFCVVNDTVSELLVKRFLFNFKLVDSKMNSLTYEVSYDELKPIHFASSFSPLEIDVDFPKIMKIQYISDTLHLIHTIRRLLELQICGCISKYFPVVLDGSFDYHDDLEKAYISKFNNVVAVSKKTRLITENHNSLVEFFNEFASNENISSPWIVKLGKLNIFDVYAIKFHDAFPYVFRLDSLATNLEHIVGGMLYHSKDGLVPGYPYGLVLIDHFARVSNDDARLQKLMLELKTGKIIYDLHEEFNTFY